MHITFNTEDLSGLDLQVLALVAGGEAPKAAAAPKAAKPAPKSEKPAPKAAKEEAPGEEEPQDGGSTLEDAVKLATKLVSNGEAAKVKAALGNVGAKKVSEIPEDKVDEFIAELS